MTDPLEYHGRTPSVLSNHLEENSNIESKQPISDSLEATSSSDISLTKLDSEVGSSSRDAAGASTNTPYDETSSILPSHSATEAHAEPPSSNSSELPKPIQSSSVSNRTVTWPEDMLREITSVFENIMSIYKARDPVSANAEIPSAAMPSYSVQPASTTLGESISSLVSEVGQLFNIMDSVEKAVSAPVAGSGTQAPSPPSASSSANPLQLADPIARIGSVFSALNPSSPSSSSSPASSRSAQNFMGLGRKAFITNPVLLQLSLSQIASHMQTLTPGEPTYIFCQSNLGLLLLHLYELTWNDKHLDGGVGSTSVAVMAVDMKDPGEMVIYIPMLLRNWAFGLRLLVRRDGDISHLHLAIRILSLAWNIYKDIDEKIISNYAKGLWRSELGVCLFDRFCATGVLADLDDAIQHLQAPSDKGHMVSYLGLAHYERFLQTGNIDDLDRALYHSRQEFQGTDANEPISFFKLGNTPQDPDEVMGRHLYGLVLAQRFNMTLDIRDLDRAIESCQNALKALSPSHPMRAYFQADLALIFFSRFEAQEESEDLRTALEMIRSTVLVFENSNEGKLGRYTRVPPKAIYGYFLSVGGKMESDPLGVEEGIRHLTSSRKTFSGPPFWESRIEYYLSEAYLIQFNLTDSATDKAEILESIVHHATLAFEKSNENSPYHFHLGLHLGNLLTMSYELSMNQTRLHDAIALFCSVALSSTWPSIRFDAAVKWADAADLLAEDGTIDALEVALSILPSLAWAGNRMPIQYRTLLSQQPAVASRAVIHALDAGEVAKAVSYLESGRNILWAQALQLRSNQLTSEDRRSEEQKYLSRYLSWQRHRIEKLPMSAIFSDSLPQRLQRLQREGAPTELQDIVRSLGGMFNTLQQRLVELKGREEVARDFASIDQLKTDIHEGIVDASLHNAARRWDELQKSVDEVDGMLPSAGQTLLNLNDNDLAKVLQTGSIVVLNTYGPRCDAIIIGQKHGSVDLQHLSLPDISGEEAKAWAESLPQGLYDLGCGEISMVDFEEVFLVPVLQSLWKGIACPVLDYLDLQKEKKRVWWYPTGPLAFLPIHAASPCEGDKPGLPELIISSYLPSIHSFIRAYRASKEPLRILAVGQPNTPGHAPLPSVNKEIQVIQKLTRGAPDSLTTIMGEDATVFKVMKSLPEHTGLHFACHANQDPSYPFNSAFFLHDGPFHLSKIMNLDLSRVQFAFLSACLTSSGDFNLPDECIHLAAGMQFAGVRSLVATIWSVYDTASSMTTSYVYKNLLKRGIQNAEAQNTAEALHLAILEMKRLNVPLTCRVPFIHLGI